MSIRAEVRPAAVAGALELYLFLDDTCVTLDASDDWELSIRSHCDADRPVVMIIPELAGPIADSLEACARALRGAAPRADHSTLDDEAWLQAESVRAQPAELEQDSEQPDDLLYDAWCVIANVGHLRGGWSAQHAEWIAAAERWRDNWHATLNATPAPAKTLEPAFGDTDVPGACKALNAAGIEDTQQLALALKTTVAEINQLEREHFVAAAREAIRTVRGEQ